MVIGENSSASIQDEYKLQKVNQHCIDSQVRIFGPHLFLSNFMVKLALKKLDWKHLQTFLFYTHPV